MLDIDAVSSEQAEQRVGQLIHWRYGTGWGAARRVLGTFLLPKLADAAHFGALVAAEQTMLPALDVAPPDTEWDAQQVTVDARHHLVYSVATRLAYRWLDRHN